MELPKIPINDIYKVCILNDVNDVSHIIVFSGNTLTDEQLNEIFSETELNEYRDKIIYSEFQIHKDDSIYHIKKKIIHALGINNVCYEEIYMFINSAEEISLMNLYQSITKGETRPFLIEHLTQLFINLNITGKDADNYLLEMMNKDNIVYDDLVKILGSKKQYNMSIPFGQVFEHAYNYLFSSNPFTIHKDMVGWIDENDRMLTLDNQLLLNYPNLKNQTIFVCLTDPVINHTDYIGIDPAYITQTYFPFLYKKNILSKDDFIREHLSLIDINKTIINKNTLDYFKTIDLFYNIYNSPSNNTPSNNLPSTNLTYNKRGIRKFHIKIKSDLNNTLPLEVVFKNIHATKEIPFIKYNPGSRRENIYRLYSEKKTRDGKFIPILSETTIMRLSKETGKQKEISLYIQYTENDILIPFFIDIDINGDVNIHTEIKILMNVDELTILLKKVVNPIIDNMNGFLEKTGYKIHNLYSLKDPYIEIIYMNYITEYKLEYKFDITKYRFISSIFDILSQENDEINMIFKRVENFQEMDAQSSLITETYKKTNNIIQVIETLMKNYNLSQEESQLQVTKYFNENKVIRGKIMVNTGFPVTFKINDEVLIIEVDNIISLPYLDVLFVYLDTILRITQDFKHIPYKEEIRKYSRVSKMKKDEKPHIENVIETTIQPHVPIIKAIQLFNENEEGVVEEEEEDYENAVFFMPESDEEDSESSNESSSENDNKGGGNSDAEDNDDDDEDDEGDDTLFKINPVGKSLKNPSIFLKSMKKRDPALFVTKEDGNYEGYSRTCSASARKQPIIVTKTELDKINKESRGSYTDAIKYGSDKNNPYYYICPRYWCLLTNTSMTEDDVKAGKCANQGVPDKIIPKNATKVPSDAFVYEFNDSKQHHRSGSSEYVYNYPGFITGTHPKGYGLPCCFKKPKVNWEGYNIPEEDENIVIKKKKKKDLQKIEDNRETATYIISNETFPIKEPHRFGFLPIAVQLFLQINNNDFVTENNAAIIKPNVECLLRYGVEQSAKQSILGSIAELYAYSQGLTKTPSVEELKHIMVDAITLDDYIRYNNGYLVSIFKPDKINLDKIKENQSKYENTEFYKQFDMNELTDNESDFLEDTLASYENFMDYIMSNDSIIDHVYLWDVITSHNDRFIKQGVNLIILEIVNNDITNNIKVICPTNSQSAKVYDSSKETYILLKKNEYYEPIYMYKEVNREIIKKRVFYDNPINKDQIVNKNLKKILSIIGKSFSKCSPKPSLPTVYHFKKNIQVESLYGLLKNNQYSILSQISNYQGQIIGIVATRNIDDPELYIFVPCLPSAPIYIMNDVPKKMMDDGDAKIWNTYEKTIEELTKLNEITNGKVLCSPRLKVIDDDNKLIIGILTETNQFIQIDPPNENIHYDNIPVLHSSNYIIADKTIASSQPEDMERERMIKMISLESQFYALFRSTIRNLLNEYEMRDIRAQLLSIFENHQMIYRRKIINIIRLIKVLAKDKIIFNDIAEEILLKYEELSRFSTNYGKDEYCIRKENGKCVIVIPKKHLISSHDNEKIYFGRIADELLRYKRIRLFMMHPKQYLNITNVDYKINADEFILIQSSLSNDYLKNLVPFNNSSNIVSTNYYNAQPQISQTYANEDIPITEQYADAPVDSSQLNDNVIGCIKHIIDVTGNQQSIWKRIFAKSKEIVFKNTNTMCSFYILIYIFQMKYKQVASVLQIKQSIWDGYKSYYKAHKSKILHILKLQGKNAIVQKIEKGESFETIIMSESYYLTDLDIWVFSENTKLQLCLFSANGLYSLNKNINWLMLRNAYTEPIFFIRSPSMILNAPGSYSVIDKPHTLGTLGEFQTIVQNAISGLSMDIGNLTDLTSYLKNYSV